MQAAPETTIEGMSAFNMQHQMNGNVATYEVDGMVGPIPVDGINAFAGFTAGLSSGWTEDAGVGTVYASALLQRGGSEVGVRVESSLSGARDSTGGTYMAGVFATRAWMRVNGRSAEANMSLSLTSTAQAKNAPFQVANPEQSDAAACRVLSNLDQRAGESLHHGYGTSRGFGPVIAALAQIGAGGFGGATGGQVFSGEALGFFGHQSEPLAYILGSGTDHSDHSWLVNRCDSDLNKPFVVYSGSKFIAALQIMRLVEDGLLSLDDKVADYLSHPHPVGWDTSGPKSRVTIRHLLSMTSGFGEHACASDITNSFSLTECVKLIHDGSFRDLTSTKGMGAEAQQVDATTVEPGSYWVYSSSGYQVAAAVAEKAMESTSGGTFNDLYLRTFNPQDNTALSGWSWPNRRNPNYSGGLVISPADYARIMGRYFSGSLLNATSMAEMEKAQTFELGAQMLDIASWSSRSAETQYALGMWRECEDGTSNCDNPILDSTGALSFRPFIDRAGPVHYWGVLVTSQLGQTSNVDYRSLWPTFRDHFSRPGSSTPGNGPQCSSWNASCDAGVSFEGVASFGVSQRGHIIASSAATAWANFLVTATPDTLCLQMPGGASMSGDMRDFANTICHLVGTINAAAHVGNPSLPTLSGSCDVFSTLPSSIIHVDVTYDINAQFSSTGFWSSVALTAGIEMSIDSWFQLVCKFNQWISSAATSPCDNMNFITSFAGRLDERMSLAAVVDSRPEASKLLSVWGAFPVQPAGSVRYATVMMKGDFFWNNGCDGRYYTLIDLGAVAAFKLGQSVAWIIAEGWDGVRRAELCYPTSSCGDSIATCSLIFWERNCGMRCFKMRYNQDLMELKFRLEFESHVPKDGSSPYTELRIDGSLHFKGPLAFVAAFFPWRNPLAFQSSVVLDGSETSVMFTVASRLPAGWDIDILGFDFGISIPFPCWLRFICLKYTVGSTSGLFGTGLEFCTEAEHPICTGGNLGAVQTQDWFKGQPMLPTCSAGANVAPLQLSNSLYYTLQTGADECPQADIIRSPKLCREAARSLGLPVGQGRNWTGSDANIQRHCSFALDAVGGQDLGQLSQLGADFSQPSRLHFNFGHDHAARRRSNRHNQHGTREYNLRSVSLPKSKLCPVCVNSAQLSIQMSAAANSTQADNIRMCAFPQVANGSFVPTAGSSISSVVDGSILSDDVGIIHCAQGFVRSRFEDFECICLETGGQCRQLENACIPRTTSWRTDCPQEYQACANSSSCSAEINSGVPTSDFASKDGISLHACLTADYIWNVSAFPPCKQVCGSRRPVTRRVEGCIRVPNIANIPAAGVGHGDRASAGNGGQASMPDQMPTGSDADEAPDADEAQHPGSGEASGIVLVPDEKCVDTGAEYPQTTLECPPLAVGSACDDGFNTTENDSCQDLEMPTCAGVCIAGHTDIQQFSVQWFEYTAASTTLVTDIGSNHTELFDGSVHGQLFQVLEDAEAFWMAKSTEWPAQLYDEDGDIIMAANASVTNEIKDQMDRWRSPCAPCRPGFYKDGMPSRGLCRACPRGTISPAGAKNSSACVCKKGYGGQDCLKCEAGKYKSVTGGDACSDCPANYNSTPGAISVDECDTCASSISEQQCNMIMHERALAGGLSANLLQVCPLLRDKFVYKAQLDPSTLEHSEKQAICDEMSLNFHDNECFRALDALPTHKRCDDFFLFCQELRSDSPAATDCPVLHQILQGDMSQSRMQSLSDSDSDAICYEWTANQFDNSCFNATTQAKQSTCAQLASLCVPGSGSPCPSSPCTVSNVSAGPEDKPVWMNSNLEEACPMLNKLFVIKAHSDLLKMTSSDIDSVCLEWTLNDFNNSCSDAVLDNTTDPGVCRGFASVCGLSLESTPCPKNSGRGIEKLLQDAAISYPDCHLNLAWKNLTDQMAMEDMKGLPRSVATGGLGQLMYTNGTLTPYEVWLCVWDEGCAQGTDDAFCFAFNENEEVFVPWVPFCLTRLTLITLCLSVVLRHLALSCVIARLIEDDKRESIARELT